MNLLEEVKQAGWDPFAPSEECRSATARPAMSDRLAGPDIVGIHWVLVILQLMRRFGREKSWRGERGRQLMKAAVLYVMTQVSMEGDLTPERAERAALRLDRWFQETYLPSRRRVEEAVAAGVDVVKAQAQFEPAFSMIFHQHQLGLGAVEDDMRAMAWARSMHESGKRSPKSPVPTTVEELDAYFGLVCDERYLVRFDEDGKMRLCTEEVKTALDSVLGRALASKPSPELALEECTEADEVVQAVGASLDARAVRDAIEKRRAKAREGSARRHVLEHFEELLSGGTTFRQLGERVNLSASALDEAFLEEKRAIQALLRAA